MKTNGWACMKNLIKICVWFCTQLKKSDMLWGSSPYKAWASQKNCSVTNLECSSNTLVHIDGPFKHLMASIGQGLDKAIFWVLLWCIWRNNFWFGVVELEGKLFFDGVQF